ncbi:hypothetical protein [Paenibacillus qinlingensis]|uniref:hypothetical protein n=1 Tax=Paenibacillus qinlingensis TaxID=1837343 RepID=UPI00286A2561|nr:hypothetical protein [Paenibacillus qinlingensis]
MNTIILYLEVLLLYVGIKNGSNYVIFDYENSAVISWRAHHPKVDSGVYFPRKDECQKRFHSYAKYRKRTPSHHWQHDEPVTTNEQADQGKNHGAS